MSPARKTATRVVARSRTGLEERTRGGGDAHVALLRGINVGGKNMLPMTTLAEMFAKAGCAEVRTFINSGNVVFRATPAVVERLAQAISKDIERRFDLRVPVVLRTAEELGRVARKNPFLARKVDADELHVMFLSDVPVKSAVAALDAQRSPGDEFVVVGREIYMRLPNGAGKTKLTNAYFDARLETTSTLRNWRTVLKLIELVKG